MVLFALVAVVVARPGNLGLAYSYTAPLAYAAPLAYSAPLTVVKSVPTSVSHQSSTVVHDSAPVVAPVVAPAVVGAHYTPALAYSAPLLHAW